MSKVIVVIVFAIGLVGCQMGTVSRVGGGPAKLEAPKDCHQVINMGHNGKGGKFLCYRTIDGVVKLKEYSDLGILEAEYELSGMTFDSNLIVK